MSDGTMDSRAAKGIAANLREIARATAALEAWRIEGKGKASEWMETECKEIVSNAEKAIADWLTQPMTWR